MKKYTVILTGALMISWFAPAVSEAADNLAVETTWISEYHEDISGDLITVRYDAVGVPDGAVSSSAPVQAAYERMNHQQTDEAVDYQNWYEYLLAEYVQDNGGVEGFIPCSYYSSANIKRNDDRYVSVLYKTDAYAGGAHPNCWYRSYNFDVTSGEELTAADVINDMEALSAVLRSSLAVCYPDLDASLLDEYTAEELTWTLEEDGITIYFGEYMLGSLYDGAQTIHISYSDYPGLFHENVIELTDFTTKALGNYEPVWLDADGNGESELLSVGMNTGEGKTADQNRYLNISYGDYALQEHLPECNALYPALLTADGKTYLYLQADMDMDIAWSGLYVLTGSEAIYQGDDLLPGMDPGVSYMVIQYPVDTSVLIENQNGWYDSPEPEDYTAADMSFYGVWISASKNLEASWELADLIRHDGVTGYVYVSSEWSNLNPETWYLVSAGIYETYEDALAGLDRMHEAGYADAYIKWSGEYLTQ